MMPANMVDDLDDCVENALKTLLNVTEVSKNLRQDLKQDIVHSVSDLRKAISLLKSELTDKDNELNDLRVKCKNAQDQLRVKNHRVASQWTSAASSLAGHLQPLEPASQRIPAASSLAGQQQPLHFAGNSQWETSSAQRRSYAAVARGPQQVIQAKTFKLFVKTKTNHSTEHMKAIVKKNVNPIEMKVGINSFKGLHNGQLLIESGNETDIDTICKTINEKCGEELEARASKLRNPRIIIFNVPDEITTDNIVGAITTQNPELGQYEKEVQPKFSFEDRKKNTNIVIEVSAEARKQIIGRKLKIGWNMCNWDDYIRISRCFKCCKYNHRAQECKGNQTCPNCTQTHALKDCKVNKVDYKCINCVNYNKHNKENVVNVNHSTLDSNCPCHQAAILRYQQSIGY